MQLCMTLFGAWDFWTANNIRLGASIVQTLQECASNRDAFPLIKICLCTRERTTCAHDDIHVRAVTTYRAREKEKRGERGCNVNASTQFIARAFVRARLYLSVELLIQTSTCRACGHKSRTLFLPFLGFALFITAIQ